LIGSFETFLGTTSVYCLKLKSAFSIWRLIKYMRAKSNWLSGYSIRHIRYLFSLENLFSKNPCSLHCSPI